MGGLLKGAGFLFEAINVLKWTLVIVAQIFVYPKTSELYTLNG